MRKRLVRAALVLGAIVGLMTAALPAHADPCEVKIKNVYIDLIDCG